MLSIVIHPSARLQSTVIGYYASAKQIVKAWNQPERGGNGEEKKKKRVDEGEKGAVNKIYSLRRCATVSATFVQHMQYTMANSMKKCSIAICTHRFYEKKIIKLS